MIPPDTHFLFRNRGDGTFEDATERAGVLRRDGRGMGVVAADVNRDGRIDLYVANDMCPNFLFLNQGDGTFEDVTETSGAAVTRVGPLPGGHGGRRRGPRRRRAPRAVRHQLPRRIQHHLPDDRRPELPGRQRPGRDRPGQHARRRLGLRPGRLRQRRLARHAGRQRPRRRQPGGARPRRRLRRSVAKVWRNRGGGRFRLVRRPRALLRRRPRRPRARPSATSTTTATSTWSSASWTAGRRSC